MVGDAQNDVKSLIGRWLVRDVKAGRALVVVSFDGELPYWSSVMRASRR